MRYVLDMYKIGERIRKERIATGHTQSEFAVALKLQEDSRTSVGKWENGLSLPSFEILIKMCRIFDCELDYLLCQPEYAGKTRKKTDVQKATGLSKKAVEKLFSLRKRTKGVDGSFSNFDFHINAILVDDNFAELLEAIKRHVWSFNRKNYKIDKENAEIHESLANTFNCEPHELRRYIEMTSQKLIETIIMKIVNGIENEQEVTKKAPAKSKGKN